MKTVRVTYTVKEEYAETNKKNIGQVMSDLREINSPGISYSAHIEEDGKTFMHFATFTDENAQKKLNELNSFIKFRTELKNSKPEIEPNQTHLELVGNSKD